MHRETRERRYPAKLTVVLSFFALSTAGCWQSDEQILRREFDVPGSARLVSIQSTPESSGWFPREGLEIDAEFALSVEAFDDYREAVTKGRDWQRLPVPDVVLVQMTGIRSYLTALEHSNRVRDAASRFAGAPAATRRLPTEQELLEDWKRRLPLQSTSGSWSCRTAGDNILHAEKVPCSSRQGDLNDFMLAILDEESRTLHVRVHTAY